MKHAVCICLLSTILLAGCQDDDDKSASYEPSSEHCQPDYWKSLPDNKDRESLVEKCMTGGSYQHSEPKTF
ncbi:entry exclusion lipoprotein TrbK [Pseudomonas sp. BMS12]|uniref:entry exclusion lipoprotein TrbK n=1 Tax=Pseudomonas sp. BMS12 TaxID=1796033 RepID=UPI0009EF5528|nr:entry exclusion lipoprotein TrbK [Pseudomonas sp. BMS12]